MFDTVSIGLDIGTATIKIAAIKKRGKKIALIRWGSIPTPAGMIEGGVINNPEEMGFYLRGLVKDMNLKRGKLTTAVSGRQVYTKLIKMPYMDMYDIKKASFYQASSFLPISIDEVTTDVFPVRYFENEEGFQVEVFFVAARKTQIENLYKTCCLAGLKLSSVEVEPIALYRSFHVNIGSNEGQITGVVNIGATRAYIAIFDSGILVLLRSISLGGLMLFSQLCENSKSDLSDLGKIKPGEYQSLFNEISMELGRALDYYVLQSGGRVVNKIVICGGGSRLPGIKNYLALALDKQVEFGQFNEELLIIESHGSQNKKDLCFEYPVAIGLALRGSNIVCAT